MELPPCQYDVGCPVFFALLLSTLKGGATVIRLCSSYVC